jgi:hypothetical protein
MEENFGDNQRETKERQRRPKSGNAAACHTTEGWTNSAAIRKKGTPEHTLPPDSSTPLGRICDTTLAVRQHLVNFVATRDS